MINDYSSFDDWMVDARRLPPIIQEVIVEKTRSYTFPSLGSIKSTVCAMTGYMATSLKSIDHLVFGGYTPRTFVCRGLMLVGAAYMGYKYRNWLLERMKNFASEIEIVSKTSLSSRTLFESVRQGSEEAPGIPPKSQGVIGVLRGTKFEAYGGAHRFVDSKGNSYLVTPAHVIASVLRDSDTVHVKGNAGIIVLNAISDPINLATDLIAYPCSDDFFTRVGLKISSVGGIDEGRPVTVNIVGVEGNGTVGNIFHDNSFGYVEYTATTKPGYSGCGYYVGGRLLGIHTIGGKKNLGFSASYALMCLRQALGQKAESTEDWLTEIKERGEDFPEFERYTDEDEIRVRYKGQYHLVSSSTAERIFGKSWFNHKGRKRYGYDDSASQQLENRDFQEEPQSGASPIAAPSAQFTLEVQQDVMKRLNSQLKAISKLQSSVNKLKEACEGSRCLQQLE